LLASALSEQIAKRHLQDGEGAWVRCPIFNVGAWLTDCWRTVRYSRTNTPTLLSSSQEQALWQRVIGQEYPKLFNQAGTARLAMDATRLMAEWHIPADGEAWDDYKDAQRFQELLRRFRKLCQRNGWITCSDLWRLVPEWIGKEYLDPGPVAFAGFGRFSPALDEVRKSLGSRAETFSFDLPEADQSAPAVACADFAAELEYAARWARKRVEDDPNGTIAVFVPELSKHQVLIEQTFRQVFYPSRILQLTEQQRDESPEPLSPFHIDGSKPLSAHPLIANALLLLELARPQIAIADASAILRCPFITGARAEAGLRALADIQLRKRRDLEVALFQIEASTKGCPLLSPVWDALREVLHLRSWTLELSRWSEFISDLLRAVGWPGDNPLGGTEQEIVEIWKNALLELAGVGLVSTPVTWEAAFSQLRRIVGSTCESQIGDWLSPVQILDADEAAGLKFDSAAVLGMSDETWPTPEKGYPFVPSKLRRSLGVPGSDPQSVQEERQRKTRCLLQSAPTVLVIYSGRLAPLVRTFVETGSIQPTVWEGNLPVQSYPVGELEAVEDTNGPEFPLDDVAAGGVDVIKAQSLCPFRAFAQYRLHAHSPEDACFGIDARDRGSFLHKALERTWKDLGTLEQLQNIDSGQLRELVSAAVIEAIQDRQNNLFHQLMNQTERERLEEVILQWLAVERERKTPFRAEHLEEEKLVNLNGLLLHVRVDRMDRLPDGSVVLIDYKTGDLKGKDLEGNRPSEPQLLIYAAAVEEEVEGVYIAKVRPRAAEPVGFAHNEHFPAAKAARKKKAWAQIRDESRDHLYSIAAEFIQGYAAVKPEKGACDYCDLTALCRVLGGTKTDDNDGSSD
jgi:ATP-dependent helicase/nuclease subunit B